jgi:hypothetical protein
MRLGANQQKFKRRGREADLLTPLGVNSMGNGQTVSPSQVEGICFTHIQHYWKFQNVNLVTSIYYNTN